MAHTKRYSPETLDRAVRMVFDHENEYASQWEAIRSIASKIGCAGETLRTWVHKTEVDTGRRDGMTSSERERIKELERENREWRPRQICRSRRCRAPKRSSSSGWRSRRPGLRPDRDHRDAR